jgi:hypothetical protein
LRIEKRNVVGDAGRINCSSFSNRTKEEAEGTAARRHPHRARFGGFDTEESIPDPVAANETTATFNLTHKRNKSNIIYQKLIKNRYLDKSNPCLVISNNLHSR